MTVSSQTNKSGPYNENGVTTNFAYGFSIRDASHIKVVRALNGIETTLVLNTHYTVTGVGNPAGGSIVVPVPVSGSTLTLIRNVPYVQELDLENQGAYNAEDVEAALDLATQRDQQLSEQVARSVKVPVSSPLDPDELIADLTAAAVDAVAAAAATAADRVQTGLDRVQTGLDRVATGQDRALATLAANAAAADRVQTGQDRTQTTADRAATAADRVVTGQDRTQTGLDKAATAADRVQTGSDRTATGQDRTATAADRMQTGQDRAAAAASAASIDPANYVRNDAAQGLSTARQAQARANISAITQSDISNLPASVIGSGILPVVRGGTGADTEAGARGVYTGSNSNETSFPIGHTVMSADGGATKNSTVAVRATSNRYYSITVTTGNLLAGTWSARGSTSSSSTDGPILCQRIA